jgi:hypothetical protein
MTPITDPNAEDDATLESLLRQSRQLQDAPEAVIQRAIDIAAASAAAPQLPAQGAPARALRRLVAVLGFDSAGPPAVAAGMRSAGAGTRQLLYSTEGRDVDLRIARAPDGHHWQLSGQVLGPDAVGTARLQIGDRVHERPWSEWSEFQFDQVPPGEAVLTLCSDGWEMELPPLPLPPP